MANEKVVLNIYTSGEKYPDLVLVPEADTTDTVHLSGASSNTISNFDITGGAEDCVDFQNNSRFNTLMIGTLRPRGKFAVTIKGGSGGNTLLDVVLDGSGSEVDIDIGNYSDQSWEYTHNTWLYNVRRVDGLPVRVRVGHGAKPHVDGGNIKIMFWQSLGLKVYVYCKMLLNLKNKPKK